MIQRVIWDETYILGGFQLIHAVNDQSSRTGLVPTFQPTVTGDMLVYFTPGTFAPATYDGQRKKLEEIVDYMQATYSRSMMPYKADEVRANELHKRLLERLKKFDPNIQIIINDIRGQLITGEASNIVGDEPRFAGMSLYANDALPVQAIVLEGGKALYSMRLPAERNAEMFAVTKTDFLTMLQPIREALRAVVENK